MIEAWWFQHRDEKLRYGDNRRARVGVTHTIEGVPILRRIGLHASIRAMDALLHSHGDLRVIYRVELSGLMFIGDDRVAAQSRKYLRRIDTKHILRKFARLCALTNIEKIKPYCKEGDYNIILGFLKTGKNREVAKLAAYAAANRADASAAYRAAYAAAYCAGYAAYAAARSTAYSASQAAARSTAHSAIDYEVAYRTARDKQNVVLERMLMEATK